MYWHSVAGGVQKTLLPWLIVGVFLYLRNALHHCFHAAAQHTARLFGSASKTVDFVAYALAEGALTGISVVALTVTLLGELDGRWFSAARHLALHAMQHGAIECLVLSILFTSLGKIAVLRRALGSVPYLQTSLEGALLLDFCGREFGAEFGLAGAVTAMGPENPVIHLPFGAAVVYVAGFFAIGYVLYRALLLVRTRASVVFAEGRFEQAACVVAAYLPLAMYADLLMR